MIDNRIKKIRAEIERRMKGHCPIICSYIIYEDISSTKNTQKQYERIIAACEQELRNKNISDERRNEIIDCMIRMAESSDYAIRQSREFQHEQLDHLRKKSWIIAGTCLFLFCGTIFLKVTI